MHLDRAMILTIHRNVVTRIGRFSVSFDHQRTWHLHIRNVQPEDAGRYMCQVNTEPMLSQVGHVHVVGECSDGLLNGNALITRSREFCSPSRLEQTSRLFEIEKGARFYWARACIARSRVIAVALRFCCSNICLFRSPSSAGDRRRG